ncbi:MAG: indolepyruvate oxidoreductase subunit beta [Oscillospiraceae bacterium]
MNCLLAGVGGQGTVLASKILAQCAINRGLFARTAETIGMAQRGGCVVSHVRIGENISSPLIPIGEADLIIALEPGEAVRCLPYLKENGAIVVNSVAIKPVSDALSQTAYTADAMLCFLQQQVKRLVVVDGNAACAALGSPKVLNLILLGAAAKNNLLEFTSEEFLRVIDEKIPEKFRELNKKAILQ